MLPNSNRMMVFYDRPQRSCGQGNVFTGVCLSTGGEGVCLSACWDARPPQDQADTPPRTRQTPPGPGRSPLGPGGPPRPGRPPPGSRLQHTVYEQPVRILLECILVSKYLSPVNEVAKAMFSVVSVCLLFCCSQ